MKLFYAKNGSKKQLIFEKGDYFENCKNGHKVNATDCKIVRLGQKLKMHENMLKTLLQYIEVVLCKKRLENTDNIGKKHTILKVTNTCHEAMAIDFAKSSVCVKN